MAFNIEKFKTLSPEAQQIVFDRKGLSSEAQSIIRQKIGVDTESYTDPTTGQEVTRQTQTVEIPPQGEPTDKGYLGQVASDIAGRAGNIYDIAKRKGISKLPETLALSAGQVAVGFADVAGETVKAGYKALVPEQIQKDIKSRAKDIAKTKIGQVGLEALKSGGEAYGEFKKAYPEAAEALEGLLNIAQYGVIKKTAGATIKAAKTSVKEAVDITSDVGAATILKKSPQYIDKKLTETVEKAINKSIRPSVKKAGKNYKVYGKYHKGAKDGVERIIENKQNLKLVDETGLITEGQLPETLSQFSQAIDQTKREVFKTYNEMAKQVGGVRIDTRQVSRRLLKLSKNKHIQDRHPALIGKIDQLAETYAKRAKNKPYNIMEAQDAIQQFNRSLDSFYKNPSYEMATTAYIDGIIADSMRKAVSSKIDKLVGPGYAQLKKAYGSLASIEDDVARRAIVDLRKNTKGLIDFTDIFSVYAGLRGILRLDPATITAAAGATVTKHFFKKWNDPNYIIKNMFTDADKLKAVKDFGKSSKSKLFKHFNERRSSKSTDLTTNKPTTKERP